MGCAIGMVKYLVFIFNLVFAIAGLGLLVVGILFQLKFNDITEIMEDKTVAMAPRLIIAVGAIIFIIAFFGCCGAVRESSCMLTTYAVILLAIFILQVAVGVFAFLEVKDTDTLKSTIRKDLERTFNRYNEKKNKETVDLLQHSLKCCGVDAPSYWSTIPNSCCESNTESCSRASRDLFNEGCAPKLFHTVKDNVQTIGYVAIGICAIEIIGAVFALCLTSSIRNERRRNYN